MIELFHRGKSGAAVDQWRLTGKRVVRVALGMLIVFSIVVSAGTNAHADLAPTDQFLPNKTHYVPFDGRYLEVPAPPQRYQSRLGWLIGAYIDSLPYSYRLASASAMRKARTALVALLLEVDALRRLPKAQKEAYLLALINDLSTLEIAEADQRWYRQFFGAVVVDVVANLVGAKAGALVGGSTPTGSQSFSRSARTLASAIAGGGVDPTAVGLGTLCLKGIAGDAAVSMCASEAGAALHKKLVEATPLDRYVILRQTLLRQYLMSRCGCTAPTGNKWPPLQQWDKIIPRVRQHYQTALARILASYGKPAAETVLTFTIPNVLETAGRAQLRRAELKKIGGLKGRDLAVFLTYLVQDLEFLHKELVTDQRADARLTVSQSIGVNSIASGVGAANPLLAIAFSAAMTGAKTWLDLSKERQLLVALAGLRRSLLSRLHSLPGKCGCEPAAPTSVGWGIGINGPSAVVPGQEETWAFNAYGRQPPHDYLIAWGHQEQQNGQKVASIHKAQRIKGPDFEASHAYPDDREHKLSAHIADATGAAFGTIRVGINGIRSDPAKPIDWNMRVEGPRTLAPGEKGHWTVDFSESHFLSVEINWGDYSSEDTSSATNQVSNFERYKFMTQYLKDDRTRLALEKLDIHDNTLEPMRPVEGLSLTLSHTYREPGEYAVGISVDNTADRELYLGMRIVVADEPSAAFAD